MVVIGPAGEQAAGPEDDAALDAAIRAALARHSIKDAASLVADETGQPRRQIYARALVLAREGDGTDE